METLNNQGGEARIETEIFVTDKAKIHKLPDEKLRKIQHGGKAAAEKMNTSGQAAPIRKAAPVADPNV